jgi:hypothetical protein
MKVGPPYREQAKSIQVWMDLHSPPVERRTATGGGFLRNGRRASIRCSAARGTGRSGKGLGMMKSKAPAEAALVAFRGPCGREAALGQLDGELH